MIIDIELIIFIMRQVADKDKVDPIDTVHNEAIITLEELLRFAQAISKYTQNNQ